MHLVHYQFYDGLLLSVLTPNLVLFSFHVYSVYPLLISCLPRVTLLLYPVCYVRYTVSGMSLINRGSRWVAHPLLEGLVTAARKAGLWNLWMPSTLAGEILEGHAFVPFYVYLFLYSLVSNIYPLSFFSSIFQFFIFLLLEELQEKHPNWPWALLLPHIALSNTDYAFIAIESGRFVWLADRILLTSFLLHPIILFISSLTYFHATFSTLHILITLL